MRVSCDDKMTLFVDGVEKSVDGQDKWDQISIFTVPTSIQVIAIKGINQKAAKGIVGSIHDFMGKDILVTDKSWSCSGEWEDGWQGANFVMGEKWQPAHEQEGHYQLGDVSPWNVLSPNRKSIWTTDLTKKTVYCRKIISCK